MFRALDVGAIGVGVGYEEAVQLAAHFGFEGVCLDPGYIRETGPETVVQMLDERGLVSGGWGLPVAPLAPQEEFQQQLEALAGIAQACSRAADCRCATWIAPASDKMPYEELFAVLRDRLRAVAQVLAEHDVRLGLEFIGPARSRAGREHEFIYTMDGMLDLCSAIGTGNVGLLLDAWHLYTSGGRMDDVLSLTDDDIVVVHINDAPAGIPVEEQVDSVRELPGATGVIDGRRFLACLNEIGYSGPVVVEPFCERVRQMEAEEAIQATKEAVDAVWPD